MAVLNTIRAYNSFILLVNTPPNILGAAAGVGSLAILTNGAVYLKTDINDTDWTLVVTPSGGTTPIVEYREISVLESEAKALSLAYAPTDPTLVQLDIISGGPQQYDFDYAVAGAILSWDGMNLDGVLSAGDKLRIAYFTY